MDKLEAAIGNLKATSAILRDCTSELIKGGVDANQCKQLLDKLAQTDALTADLMRIQKQLTPSKQ